MADLLVDAANVVGSRPDGWWRDRAGATARLLGRLARLPGRVPAAPEGAPFDCTAVVAVVEGRAREVPPRRLCGCVRAEGSGDDALVGRRRRAGAGGLLVVTADRGLRARLPAGTAVAGPGWLLVRLDATGARTGMTSGPAGKARDAERRRAGHGPEPRPRPEELMPRADHRRSRIPRDRPDHRRLQRHRPGDRRSSSAGRGARLVLVARGRTRSRRPPTRPVPPVPPRCSSARPTSPTRTRVRAAVDAAVELFGRLDAVVHAAQVMAYGRIEEVPREVFETVVDTAVHGTADVARVVLPVFRRQGGGHLVVVNSLLGRSPRR